MRRRERSVKPEKGKGFKIYFPTLAHPTPRVGPDGAHLCVFIAERDKPRSLLPLVSSLGFSSYQLPSWRFEIWNSKRLLLR